MNVDPPRAPLLAGALEGLRAALPEPWRRLDAVATTGSTNQDLVDRSASEDVDGHVLTAEHQTAGRGRNGRRWTDVPSALLMVSVGVSARSVPAEAWGWLPLAAGVAVVDTVRAAGVDPAACGLKWPNDVLAGVPPRRKLAGILAEVASQRSIIVGIGLNVTLAEGEVHDADAVSLAELGARVDRAWLLATLLGELGRRIVQWRDGEGVSPTLIADYDDRSSTLGARVRAILPGGAELQGVARSIDQRGRLVIDTGADMAAVAAGDVVHVRT